ncbi:Hypothetical predicted protein [Lecanosticta acicola]|uniref:Uncharacterized protein n=1 Tax=Lecanosticta acicola TaxID=111012 RepID=A0AAI8Z7P2_9PEZI|nr:Hypothetical predicted protein [Lecanosticta acicola]
MDGAASYDPPGGYESSTAVTPAAKTLNQLHHELEPLAIDVGTLIMLVLNVAVLIVAVLLCVLLFIFVLCWLCLFWLQARLLLGASFALQACMQEPVTSCGSQTQAPDDTDSEYQTASEGTDSEYQTASEGTDPQQYSNDQDETSEHDVELFDQENLAQQAPDEGVDSQERVNDDDASEVNLPNHESHAIMESSGDQWPSPEAPAVQEQPQAKRDQAEWMAEPLSSGPEGITGRDESQVLSEQLQSADKVSNERAPNTQPPSRFSAEQLEAARNFMAEATPPQPKAKAGRSTQPPRRYQPAQARGPSGRQALQHPVDRPSRPQASATTTNRAPMLPPNPDAAVPPHLRKLQAAQAKQVDFPTAGSGREARATSHDLSGRVGNAATAVNGPDPLYADENQAPKLHARTVFHRPEAFSKPDTNALQATHHAARGPTTGITAKSLPAAEKETQDTLPLALALPAMDLEQADGDLLGADTAPKAPSSLSPNTAPVRLSTAEELISLDTVQTPSNAQTVLCSQCDRWTAQPSRMGQYGLCMHCASAMPKIEHAKQVITGKTSEAFSAKTTKGKEARAPPGLGAAQSDRQGEFDLLLAGEATAASVAESDTVKHRRGEQETSPPSETEVAESDVANQGLTPPASEVQDEEAATQTPPQQGTRREKKAARGTAREALKEAWCDRELARSRVVDGWSYEDAQELVEATRRYMGKRNALMEVSKNHQLEDDDAKFYPSFREADCMKPKHSPVTKVELSDLKKRRAAEKLATDGAESTKADASQGAAVDAESEALENMKAARRLRQNALDHFEPAMHPSNPGYAQWKKEGDAKLARANSHYKKKREKLVADMGGSLPSKLALEFPGI